MGPPPPLRVQCQSFSFQQGTKMAPKVCYDQPVALEGRQLFLGTKSQYASKIKDWVSLTATAEEIVWHTSKGQTYTLIPEPDATVKEEEQWQRLGEKLRTLFQKYGPPSSNAKFAGTNLAVSPSKRFVGRHHAPPPRRGVFGSQPAARHKLAAVPWDDEIISPKQQPEAKVPQQARSWNKSRRQAKQRLRQLDAEERFSEDDDSADDKDKEILEHKPDETAKASSPARSDFAPSSDEEEEDEKAAASSTSKPQQRPGAARGRSGKRLAKMQQHRALRRDNSDSTDEDDDIFEFDGDVTTPATQHVVSPGGTSRTTTTTLRKKSVVDQDEDDDADYDNIDESSPVKEVVPSEKGQPSVSSYFKAKPKSSDGGTEPRSFLPQNKHVDKKTPFALEAAMTTTTATNQQTPPRPLRTGQSARFAAAHNTSKKKSKSYTPTTWMLQTSPTQRSPAEKLFGRDAAAMRTSGSKRPLEPEEEDNIVDSDDDDGEVVSKLRRLTVKRPKLHRGLKENKYNYKSNHNWSSSIKHYDRQYPRSPLRATPRLILGNNDGEDDEDNTPKPRLRGLRNLGNTCYQNASLQMLYTCRGFMASLQRQCHQAGGDLDLTGALCRVDSDLQRPSTFFPANPAPVKEAMDRKTDKFVGYEQRDAHEFLSDLVDCVHEELEAGSRSSNNNDGEAAQQPKYPTDDFCLTVQVCLKCLSCGYSRNKEEMYRHLSIDIVSDKEIDDGKSSSDPPSTPPRKTAISKASVESSLAHFFQPEVREIKCEKCEEGTHAEQTLHILKRPKILLLHLKRFIVVEKKVYPDDQKQGGEENQPPNSPVKPISVEYLFQKNKARVAMPLNLTLEPFQVTQKDESAAAAPASLLGRDYALKSVVHHIGSRASSGHYIADALRRVEVDDDENDSKAIQDDGDVVAESSAKAPAGKKKMEDAWFTFDDTQSARRETQKITQDPQKQETAYMLLYSCLDDNEDDDGGGGRKPPASGTKTVEPDIAVVESF